VRELPEECSLYCAKHPSGNLRRVLIFSVYIFEKIDFVYKEAVIEPVLHERRGEDDFFIGKNILCDTGEVLTDCLMRSGSQVGLIGSRIEEASRNAALCIDITDKGALNPVAVQFGDNAFSERIGGDPFPEERFPAVPVLLIDTGIQEDFFSPVELFGSLY